MVQEHFANPSIMTPSSALRITLNAGEGSYFGEKYKVEKVNSDLFLSMIGILNFGEGI